ncbi:MAG: HAMP domain-containing protein [Candidatus Paceibacterota bacterium]
MKPLKKKYSLKAKLLGAVGVEVLLFLVIALALQIQQTGDIIKEQLDIYGNSMSVALADFSIEDLLSSNYPALQLSVNYIGEQDTQILGIEVYKQNRIVARYISEEVDEENWNDPEKCEKCGNTYVAPVIYEPIDQPPMDLGVVKFYLSDEMYEEFLATQIRLIWILGIFLLLGDIIASFWIIKLLVLSPLKKVSEGAEIMSKGDLDHRIEAPTQDEIGTLAKTLNKLASDLQENYDQMKDQTDKLKESERELQDAKSSLEDKVVARTKQLEELNKSLEGKVQERTKELQDRVNELEKFHELTVGREEKMIELKEKLEELEKELKQYKDESGGSVDENQE